MLKGLLDVKHGRHIVSLLLRIMTAAILVQPRYAWLPHATIAFSRVSRTKHLRDSPCNLFNKLDVT